MAHHVADHAFELVIGPVLNQTLRHFEWVGRDELLHDFAPQALIGFGLRSYLQVLANLRSQGGQ